MPTHTCEADDPGSVALLLELNAVRKPRRGTIRLPNSSALRVKYLWSGMDGTDSPSPPGGP